MFTRDSRKLRLVLASAGSVLLLAGALQAGLLELAHQVESQGDVYPWRHEDYLRWMLPGLFADQGMERVWLAGGSDVRECFLYERFQEVFPNLHVFQAGLSLGTFDDVLLGLDYVEQTYGEGALPRVVVLGITARFVANIPRDSSPLVGTINKYSPQFRVQADPGGSRLVAKDRQEGWFGRLSFLAKQQPRFRAAVCTAADRLLSAAGLESRLNRLLRTYSSPYKYHHLTPWSAEVIEGWVLADDSFWFKTHEWDPADEAALVRGQFARLLDFAKKRRIELFVVNIPEHPLVRKHYRSGRYEAYLELVRRSLGDTPFLDLREALPAQEFYDAAHPTAAGAQKVTERVLDFIREQRTPEAAEVIGKNGGRP